MKRKNKNIPHDKWTEFEKQLKTIRFGLGNPNSIRILIQEEEEWWGPVFDVWHNGYNYGNYCETNAHKQEP